ncbi:AcvB/VirJ family lysyl-phosphatidylglycerol hydrolase [Frigidibacter sp. MR17.24]|uniref:AcvB/VirJ family lysyl-phosphatidylglycerol hydrolase n=1 Tax=Frigidibacter sp. MR17.24 TaxID=3127345 RepID=UPI003012F282
MRPSRRRLALAGLGGIALIALAGVGLDLWRRMPAALPAPAAHVSVRLLQDIPVYAPPKGVTPRAVVVHFSDGDDGVPRALVQAGAVVLPVDTESFRKAVAARAIAEKQDCVYLAGDVGDLAIAAERALGMTDYLQPIFTGTGPGATMAYLSFGNAPANTLTGAIGAGFDNRIEMPIPFCPVPAMTRTAAGPWEAALDAPMQGRAILFAGAGDLARFQAMAGGNDTLTVEPDAGTPAEQITAALDRLAPRGEGAALPVTDLPAQDATGAAAAPRALAVIYSGDGGWRDIDMRIGEILQKDGLHVLGVDSLRYFWAQKSPGTIAADLSRLIESADPGHELPVMLIGYSFGADILPFAVPLLPQAQRDRIGLTALLAPGRTTDFRIHVSGWLGMQSGAADIPGAIARLAPATTLCVWGEKEGEASACTDPALAGVAQLKTAGGHHFDGDYATLAQRLLDRFGTSDAALQHGQGKVAQ